MQCRPMAAHCRASAMASSDTGCARSGAAVSCDLTWENMIKLAADWLPKPEIRHPWPRDRFAVKHPRWEPYAGKPLVRFCAGGVQ